ACSVRYTLPAMPATPVSNTRASGSSCFRTAEAEPSAPTSTSPRAEVPSARCTTTWPSDERPEPTTALSKATTSSKPLSSSWRKPARPIGCACDRRVHWIGLGYESEVVQLLGSERDAAG